MARTNCRSVRAAIARKHGASATRSGCLAVDREPLRAIPGIYSPGRGAR